MDYGYGTRWGELGIKPMQSRSAVDSWMRGGSLPGAGFNPMEYFGQYNPVNEYYIRRAFAGGPLSDAAFNAMKPYDPNIQRDVTGEQFQRVGETFEGGGTQPLMAAGGGAMGRLQSWGASSGMGRSGVYGDALRALQTEEARQKETVGQEQAARLATLGMWQGLFGGMGGAPGSGGGAATSPGAPFRAGGAPLPPGYYGGRPQTENAGGWADYSGWANPFAKFGGGQGGQGLRVW